MKGLCTECKKRDKCTELCKRAEIYVNQDNVPRESLTESDVKKINPYFSIEDFSSDFSSLQYNTVPGRKTMTNRELMVSILLRCGFPAKNINKVLKLRAQNFHNLLASVREKMYK